MSSTKEENAMSPVHYQPFEESTQERLRQLGFTNNVRQAAVSNDQPMMTLLNTTRSTGKENQVWVLRSLFAKEINTLESPFCRCNCDDWSKIRLLLPKAKAERDASKKLKALVTDNRFGGFVVIGIDHTDNEEQTTSDAAPSATWEWQTVLPPGIRSNSFIYNCIFGPNCRVYRNTIISDTHVSRNAVVLNCGRISCTKQVKYGHLNIKVGPESGGGRHLELTPESTIIDVCNGLRNFQRKTVSSEDFTVFCDCNFIGRNAIVRDTPTVQNIFLAPDSCIEAATEVSNAVLLRESQIRNASSAYNVMLQWNATIADNSTVSDTLLMEHAESGPHSIVTSTVLGPDVHVSAGEVHASVIGPNTNAHHQSLVISVLWPLGRGNIAYGANVGSNHTGRLPDQETFAGEGVFWGLNCVVKFPVDLTFSPYSVVAAGTTLVPQRVAMPFSLFVHGDDGVCEIVPGWVLQHSPYTLLRAEKKFASRRKAKNHLFYTGYSVIRPDIVDMCLVARDALRGVIDEEKYQNAKAVPGIGKNRLAEKARMVGISAYTDCIQNYAIQGLLKWLQEVASSDQDIVSALHGQFPADSASDSQNPTHQLQKPCWPTLPWKQQNDLSLWNHQMAILKMEFPVKDSPNVSSWAAKLLQKLVELEFDYAERIYTSKNRDNLRGAKITPDYSESHVAADVDNVVSSVKLDVHEIKIVVSELISKIRGSNTT